MRRLQVGRPSSGLGPARFCIYADADAPGPDPSTRFARSGHSTRLAMSEAARTPAESNGAGGGNRTHTTLSSPRILSPVRLPVSPPRRKVSGVIVATTYVDCFDVSALALSRSSPLGTERALKSNQFQPFSRTQATTCPLVVARISSALTLRWSPISRSIDHMRTQSEPREAVTGRRRIRVSI